MVVASQILLYICLSLLMGIILSNAVLTAYMPKLNIPGWSIYGALAGVIVFASVAPFAIILNMSDSMSLWEATLTVLFEFNVGISWLTMVLAVIVLAVFFRANLQKDKNASRFALIFVVILAVAQGFAGHAFEQADLWGITVHTLHVLAFMVWGGLLIMLAGFTTGKTDWTRVVSWFTPLALISLTVLAVSGILIADTVSTGAVGEQPNIIQRLADSWLIDYGQALLFKQLLLVAIIGFGVINGIMMRNRLKYDSTLQIQPWIRMEALLLLLVLIVTGFMSEQSIPTQIDTIIEQGGASSLYEAFYDGNVAPDVMVSLSLDMTNAFPLILALLFFAGMIIFAKLKLHAALSFAMAICFVLYGYLGLMLMAA